MPRSTLEYLRHIRDEAQYILRTTAGLSKEQFVNDETLKRAVVRSLEVMGEAAKQVPEDFRDQHPAISWRAISGMRDRLIHGYLAVNYNIVWETVTIKVPELSNQLRGLLDEPPP
jgi:uncharacterized protein with HEPN domain